MRGCWSDSIPEAIVVGLIERHGERGRDQLVLVEYDLETLSFNPISDPIDVG